MTKINRLILKGFKSFANHTELVFGPGFNCILGPNGSGKSNVLDALTFVLGRTSSKAMRAEKAANLIYNGAKKSQPAKEAMVSIAFDNSNSIFPVEAKEVILTRVVRKNGNSIYRLNGKKSVRKDLVDMLSLARINPDGYNIILQGDIIRFVEMSTGERRQMVEEIAGIGSYEEKKKKSLNELNRVEERLKEADIVLSERKTHLKELKKERDQALEFRDMNDELQTSKATLLRKQIDDKNEDIGKLDDSEKSYAEKISSLNSKKGELKKKIEELKMQVESINKDIEVKGEKDQIDLNRSIEDLKVQIATNKTKLESYNNEVERVNNRKQELEENSKSTSHRIKALEDEKQAIEKDISFKEKELKRIEKDIDDFKKKNKFDSDAQGIEKDIDKLEKESEEMQAQIQKLREDQQQALREKDRIELFIQNIEDQMDKVAQVKKENKDQLDELKQKRARFKAVSDQLQKVLDEHSSIAEQLGSSRQKLNASNEQLAKLRAKNLSVTEKISADLALRSILDQKGKIKGIYGTVSELGQVDKQFSLALEIAAGSRIKSVVVENDQVASQCINYLKENRLGVATFLPLNKLKPRFIPAEVYDLAKKPKVHGLAINLVKHDEKFEKVFSYVFGDTLVVDDIETSRKIGIGKARMVTVEGDLVELSGAMIGGYRQKRTGIAFKEQDVMKDINEYEDIIAKLEEKISNSQERQMTLDKDITRLREEKANLEGDVIKLEKVLHIKADETEDFGTAKSKLLNDQKDVDKKIDSLQDSISDMNRELAQVKIKKQELRNKINDLRKPEVIAELRAFEDKKTELREEVIKLNAELNNFNIQINTILSPDIKKTIDILKNIEKEEQKFKQMSAELKAKIKEQEKQLKENEENATKFRAKYRKMFEQKAKLDKEIQNVEQKCSEEDFKIRGVEERVNDIKMKRAAAKGELAGLEKEFEEFVNVKVADTKKSIDDLKLRIKELERRKQAIGSVNLRALEVYEHIEKEYYELEKKKVKLAEEREDVLKLIGEIEEKKKAVFLETFDVVNNHFKQFFQKLSKKGEGFLELEDPENLFEAGVEIKVRITGNKFLDIKSLSGGEKTLTALAFIFAIQEHQPASFYVLDEVDAALDKQNSEKLAQLIRSYCSNAQYIIISHNDSIISEADKLYGISMGDHGRSNVTTLEL